MPPTAGVAGRHVGRDSPLTQDKVANVKSCVGGLPRSAGAASRRGRKRILPVLLCGEALLCALCDFCVERRGWYQLLIVCDVILGEAFLCALCDLCV